MPTRWYEYEPEDSYLKRKEKERQKEVLEKIQPPKPAPVPSRPATPQIPKQSADSMPWRAQAPAAQTPSWAQPLIPQPAQEPMSLLPQPTQITPWNGQREPMSIAPTTQRYIAPPATEPTIGAALQPTASPFAAQSNPFLPRPNPSPLTQNIGDLGRQADTLVRPVAEAARSVVAGTLGTAERLGGQISGDPAGVAERQQRFGAPSTEEYMKLNPVEQWKANEAMGRQIWDAEIYPILDAPYRHTFGPKVGILYGLQSGQIDGTEAVKQWMDTSPLLAARVMPAVRMLQGLGVSPTLLSEGDDTATALTRTYEAMDAYATLNEERSLRGALSDYKQGIRDANDLENTAPMLLRIAAGVALDPMTYLGALGAAGKLGKASTAFSALDSVQNTGMTIGIVMSDDPIQSIGMAVLQIGARKVLTGAFNAAKQRAGRPPKGSVEEQVYYLSLPIRAERILADAQQPEWQMPTTPAEMRAYDQELRTYSTAAAQELYDRVAALTPEQFAALPATDKAIVSGGLSAWKYDNDRTLTARVERIEDTFARARTSLADGLTKVSAETQRRWEELGMTREAGEVPAGGPLAGRPEEAGRVIPNSRDLVVRNVEDIPHGTGARYLLVINGENGEYVAKQWKRTVPAKMAPGETLIDFKSPAAPATTLPLGDALRPTFGGEAAIPEVNLTGTVLWDELRGMNISTANTPRKNVGRFSGTIGRGLWQDAQKVATLDGDVLRFRWGGDEWRMSREVDANDIIQSVSVARVMGQQAPAAPASSTLLSPSDLRPTFGGESAVLRPNKAPNATVAPLTFSQEQVFLTPEARARAEAQKQADAGQTSMFGGTRPAEAPETAGRQFAPAIPQSPMPPTQLEGAERNQLRQIVNGQVATTTGRAIPAPPAIRLDSSQKTANDVRKMERWLKEQVIAEAQARGDSFNLVPFEQMRPGKLTPYEYDAANEYLFGEEDPKWTTKAPVAPAGVAPEAPAVDPARTMELEMRTARSEREARQKLFDQTPPGKDVSLDDYLELSRGEERLYVERANAEEMRVAAEMGFARGDVIPPERLPETLYHVTGNLPAVSQGGWLRAGDGKHGLGGPGGGVSTVPTLAEAEWVQREMRRHIELANSTDPEALLSEFVAEDLALEAEAGRAAQTTKGLRSAEKIAREIFNSNYMVGGDAPEKSIGERGIRMYQSYVLGRADAGGQRDPVILAGDDGYKRFIGMSPDDVNIIKIGRDAATASGGTIYKMEDAVEGEILLPGPVRLDNARVVVRGQERPLPTGPLTTAAQGLASREESLRAKMVDDLRSRQRALDLRKYDVGEREKAAQFRASLGATGGTLPEWANLPETFTTIWREGGKVGVSDSPSTGFIAYTDKRLERRTAYSDAEQKAFVDQGFSWNQNRMEWEAERTPERRLWLGQKIGAALPTDADNATRRARMDDIEARFQAGSDDPFGVLAPESPKPVTRVETVPETVTEPTLVARIPTGKITIDPQRFQFKMDVNAEGVTRALDSVQVWDPALGAGVSLWKDSANGKTYVVNGHHRVALARRLGVENIDAPYMINAATAEEARFVGAMQNIAGGRGTAFDAAKLFRDNKLSDADLAARGISLSESLVSDGLALSRLHPALFTAAVRKELPLRRAVIIGSKIADQQEQWKFVQELEKLAKGKALTNDVVSELVDMFTNGPKVTTTQTDLWGNATTTQNLTLEKAEVSGYISERIKFDKNVMSYAARNATALERVGDIDVPEAERIALAAAQMGELFDKSKNAVGPIADALNDAARRIGAGENAAKVKKEAYEQIIERLPEVQQRAVGTGVREPASTGLARPVEQAAVPEAPRAEPAARVEPPAARVEEPAGRQTIDDVAARIQGQAPRGATLRGISRAQWDDVVRTGEDITSRGDLMRAEAGRKGELQTTDNVTHAVAHADGGVVIAVPRELTKSKAAFSVIRQVTGDRLPLNKVLAVFDAKTGDPLPLPGRVKEAATPAPAGPRPPEKQPVAPARPAPKPAAPARPVEAPAPVEKTQSTLSLFNARALFDGDNMEFLLDRASPQRAAVAVQDGTRIRADEWPETLPEQTALLESKGVSSQYSTAIAGMVNKLVPAANARMAAATTGTQPALGLSREETASRQEPVESEEVPMTPGRPMTDYRAEEAPRGVTQPALGLARNEGATPLVEGPPPPPRPDFGTNHVIGPPNPDTPWKARIEPLPGMEMPKEYMPPPLKAGTAPLRDVNPLSRTYEKGAINIQPLPPNPNTSVLNKIAKHTKKQPTTLKEKQRGAVNVLARMIWEPWIETYRLYEDYQSPIYPTALYVNTAKGRFKALLLDEFLPMLAPLREKADMLDDLERYMILRMAEDIDNAPIVAAHLTAQGIPSTAPVRILPAGLTDTAEIQKGIRQLQAKWGQADFDQIVNTANRYYQLMDYWTIGLGEREHMLTADGVTAARALYPHYIPLNEVRETGHGQQFVYGVHGSAPAELMRPRSESGNSAPLKHPILEGLWQLYYYQDAALRNDAAKVAVSELTRLAPIVGFDAPKQVDKIDPKKTITFYNDVGEVQMYDVPFEYARELLALDEMARNDLAMWAHKMTTPIRVGAVGANIEWAAKNWFKDQGDAWITMGIAPAKGTITAWEAAQKVTPQYLRHLWDGTVPVGLTGQVSEDLVRSLIKFGQKATPAMKSSKTGMVALRALDGYMDVIRLSEESGRERMAEWAEKYLAHMSPQERAMWSRSKPFDPDHYGYLVRYLNNFIPFTGAPISAIRGTVRAVKRDKGGAFIRAAALWAVSGALALWNNQYESYQEIPRWQRLAGFPVMLGEYEEPYDPDRPNKILKKKPVYISLAKGYDVALATAAFVAGERIIGKEVSFSQGMLDLAVDLVSSVSPVRKASDLVFPIADIAMQLEQNRDWWNDTAIVPEDKTDLPGTAQYSASTTLTARAIGDALSWLNVSPLKVDFIAREFMGGMPRQAAFITDMLLKAGGYKPEGYGEAFEKQVPTIESVARYPIVRLGLRAGGSESTRLAYDERERRVRYWNEQLLENSEARRLRQRASRPPASTIENGVSIEWTPQEMNTMLDTQEPLFISAVGLITEQDWYKALPDDLERQKTLNQLHSYLRKSTRMALAASRDPKVPFTPYTEADMESLVFSMQVKDAYDRMPQWVDRSTERPYTETQEQAVSLAVDAVEEILHAPDSPANNINQAWDIWLQDQGYARWALDAQRLYEDREPNPQKTQWGEDYYQYLEVLRDLR